jgi:hypothetical protein
MHAVRQGQPGERTLVPNVDRIAQNSELDSILTCRIFGLQTDGVLPSIERSERQARDGLGGAR